MKERHSAQVSFLRIVLPVRPLVAVNDGVGGLKCLMFAAY